MDASDSLRRVPAHHLNEHRFAARVESGKPWFLFRSDCNDRPPPIFAFAVLTAPEGAAAYPAVQA
jgi:hypothetical protein